MADSANAGQGGAGHGGEGTSRRDFLFLAVGAVGAVGAVSAVWPLIDSLNPAADIRALATSRVDLSPISEGQAITITWQGKPVFIRHRTSEEIEEARDVPMDDLIDPEPDAERVIEPQWLVMVGICTHLGCIPLGQSSSDPKGDFGGWFCPCHGSHYDTSGRIRKGPAPRNLDVPTYEFAEDTMIVIG